MNDKCQLQTPHFSNCEKVNVSTDSTYSNWNISTSRVISIEKSDHSQLDQLRCLSWNFKCPNYFLPEKLKTVISVHFWNRRSNKLLIESFPIFNCKVNLKIKKLKLVKKTDLFVLASFPIQIMWILVANPQLWCCLCVFIGKCLIVYAFLSNTQK